MDYHAATSVKLRMDAVQAECRECAADLAAGRRRSGLRTWSEGERVIARLLKELESRAQTVIATADRFSDDG